MVVDMNETVQIHEAELARLLNENQRLRAQVTEVQAYAGRLLETRTHPAEAALASLRAAAQRVVALQPGAYSEPTPAELRRFSESVNDLEDAAAKVPAPAVPVVTLSAEQAGLAIDALDVWLMNMQCVEETEAMIAVRQFLRDALEGMGESDG